MVGERGVLKKPKNLNMMVVRIDANGLLTNARPCCHCTLMMKNIGINKVYYSMDNKIICEKVSDMISINSSNSWKKVCILQYHAPTDVTEYYKKIIEKMPKKIKKVNAEYFVKYILIETEGCYYKFIKNELIIYIYDNIIGRIIIEY